jgi:nudix-type nucleoside diphosphatase (YffH/AdpP family)
MADATKTARPEIVVHGRERLHDGFVRLDRYDVELASGGRRARFERLVHDHGSGSAVLPVDEARRTVLLVGQIRVPVEVQGDDGYMVEVAAGLADPEDPDPAATAVREAREELGVVVRDLKHVVRTYTCPGIITERIDCFVARYDAADRIRGEGGGVDADEMIDVIEMGLDELADAVRAGRVTDAKTLILVQALMLDRPDLFR